MLGAFESLSLEEIQKHLETRIIGHSDRANELWDEIGSTNTRVSELAAEGVSEGIFVVARQQTAGRGRLGRVWVSPADAGVYISILLRPEHMSPSDLAPITLACGVAAAKAVERTAGIRLGLKWVNDLVFEGRKIGGILAEMPSAGTASTRETGPKRKALVIGFGMNVRLQESDVPPELREKMGWLEQITGSPIDRNLLVAQLLAEVERVYLELQSKHIDKLLAEWRSRSATLGKEIVAT
jgi:BirA family biotin operon repressor/biotin-[acetyl-CoA-carboxylase] ligase